MASVFEKEGPFLKPALIQVLKDLFFQLLQKHPIFLPAPDGILCFGAIPIFQSREAFLVVGAQDLEILTLREPLLYGVLTIGKPLIQDEQAGLNDSHLLVYRPMFW